MKAGMTTTNENGNGTRLYRDPFESLERRMNNAFANIFTPSANDSSLGNYPVDINEDEDQITFEAELPGFRRDEIEISIDNGMLTISAERATKEQDENKKRHLWERRYTKVERRFTLPRTIDTSEVDASLDAGVLTIVLKKREESKPRKIEIRE